MFPAIFNLSSLNGNNGFVINGINYDQSGYSVSGAGDVNGDGVADIIIGAPFANNAGQSYIVFGNQNGFQAQLNLTSLDGQNGFAIFGFPGQGYNSGFSVSGAGDVNGDGVADIIIGDPGADDGAGKSYVVFGSISGFQAQLYLSSLNGQNGFSIFGINRGDFSGQSVSGAGDVNGDGVDDVIIGAPTANYPAGQSYVVFGSRSGFSAQFNLVSLNGRNGFSINNANGFNSICSVAAAGDINNDGVSDVIIGVDTFDSSNQVHGYVVFGTRSGFSASFDLSNLNGVNGFVINGLSYTPDDSGGVGTAGDVNGDGVADLIINGWHNAYVVFGTRSVFPASFDLGSLDGNNGFTIDLNVGAYAYVGAAGDVNNDGIDDVMMGVFYKNENIGYTQSYVIFGDRSGFNSRFSVSDLNGANGFTINGFNGGPDINGDFGRMSLSGAGDINDDGFADIIIGASGENNFVGQSYVVFGTVRASISSTPTSTPTPSCSSTPTPPSSNAGVGEGSNLGMIIGVAVGAVVGASLIGLGVWWVMGNSCFGRKVPNKGIGEIVPNVEMAVKAGIVVTMSPVVAKAEEIIDNLGEFIGCKNVGEVDLGCIGECLALNDTSTVL